MRPSRRKRPKLGVRSGACSPTRSPDLSPELDPDLDPDFDADVGPDFEPECSPAWAGARARVRSFVVPSWDPSRWSLDDVVASAGSRTGIGGFIDSFRS